MRAIFSCCLTFKLNKNRMFCYTSKLKQEYGNELERLLFFNAGQNTVLSAIVDSIEMFGEPFVTNDGEHLRVNLKKLDEVQTLFALDGERLAGILLYSRVSPESLLVIHMAVGDDYSSYGEFSEKMLVMHMFQQLREIAVRIKGIETIRMLYGGNRTRNILVKRDTFR